MVNGTNTNWQRHWIAGIRPGEKLARAAIVQVKHVLVVSANGTKNFVVKPGDQEQVQSKKIETFILNNLCRYMKNLVVVH